MLYCRNSGLAHTADRRESSGDVVTDHSSCYNSRASKRDGIKNSHPYAGQSHATIWPQEAVG